MTGGAHTLHPGAVALRPVRVVGEEFRFYEATTFPKRPWGGCEWTLRKLRACGQLADDGSGIVLDVLDANHDVIQDFPLTKAGFEYLRRTLKFRVEPADV